MHTGFLVQIFFISIIVHMSFSSIITHIPQKRLQIVLSFWEFGKVLPKKHRKDSLAGGCPTSAKRREFGRARI